jgi:hypothetical protein
MAITIDWDTQIISVEKADMTLVQSVPIEVRRLDIDPFRLTLKDLEDDREGMPFLDTHSHNPPVTIGGVTLARVVEIINGYTITFEDGAYAVNLVGANSNIADVVNLNQVSIRSGNSAGLIDLAAIRLQSYANGAVWIDIAEGTAGDLYPLGTPPQPVDNFTDALVIAARNNFRGYHLLGTLALGVGQDIAMTEWVSPSPIVGLLALSGQDTLGATFNKMGLTGLFNGRASFDTCAMGGITGFSGIAQNCGFNGDVTINAANTENVLFKDCTSVIAGTAKPTFDINGSSGDIHFRGWIGGLKITNFTAGNDMSIDCATGSVEIDSTCTAGTIKIRMNAAKASLTDNSGVGCTVIVEQAVTEPVLSIGL